MHFSELHFYLYNDNKGNGEIKNLKSMKNNYRFGL